jgi:hypothetical protein
MLFDFIPDTWNLFEQARPFILQGPFSIPVQSTDSLAGRACPDDHQACLGVAGAPFFDCFRGNVLYPWVADHSREMLLHDSTGRVMFFYGDIARHRHLQGVNCHAKRPDSVKKTNNQDAPIKARFWKLASKSSRCNHRANSGGTRGGANSTSIPRRIAAGDLRMHIQPKVQFG